VGSLDPTQRDPGPDPKIWAALAGVLAYVYRGPAYVYRGPALFHGGPDPLLASWSVSLFLATW
jgi:hypothetical protein